MTERLSHPPKLGHGQNHLIQTDIPVSISIQDIETLLRVGCSLTTQHLNDIVQVQSIPALEDKGHPNPPCERFRGLLAFQRLHNDRMSRSRIEDLLPSNLLRNITKRSSDFPAKASDIVPDIPNQSERIRGHGALMIASFLLGRRSKNRVSNDGVLVAEHFAVLGEHVARGFVELGDEVNVPFGLLDLEIKLFPVIADGDELDDSLFAEINQTTDKKGEKDIFD